MTLNLRLAFPTSYLHQYSFNCFHFCIAKKVKTAGIRGAILQSRRRLMRVRKEQGMMEIVGGFSNGF